MPNRIRVPGAFRYRDLPAEVTYVGRAVLGYPAGPYANPHHVGKPCAHCGPGVTHDQAEAVAEYRQHLRDRPELVAAIRAQLAGSDLACWCKPDQECHGDVLLRIAAGGEP